MKKWLYPAAFIAAAILSCLPHPAVDIARLDPVRAIYLYMDGAELTIETDSGDSGTGADLEGAYAALRANAHREIFLDTAEFLILDPNVPISEPFYELLRPTTQVVFSNGKPDLETISDYLTIHPPETPLAHLRVTKTQPSALRTQH